jgi:hypothetical protein
MPGFIIAPAPRENPLVRVPTSKGDPNAYLPTEIWSKFIDNWIAVSNLKPTKIFDARLENQTASIAATDVSNGELAAGLYRVSYYTRITRAATTSSSLQVSLSWNDGTVAQLETFTALVGNTTGTHQSQTMLIRADKNSPVRYEAAYATAGAVTMAFALYVTLEHVRTL